MNQINWTAESIFESLSNPNIQDDFSKTISVRKIDDTNQVLVGVTEDLVYIFCCKQEIDVPGFSVLRAELLPDQNIEFENTSWGRTLVFKCMVNDESDALAISSIFSGLYDLAISKKSESPVELAAQAYEGYFSTKSMRKPTKSQEIGLAGELCTILASKNPSELVKGWHSSPFSTYDFSINTKRLEVKTSTSPQRFHWMKVSQSGKYSDKDLSYASVYLPETAGGSGVRELVDRIIDLIDHDSKQIFLKKINFYDLDECILKFDSTCGLKSIKFVDANLVPYPKSEDPRIIDIHWKIDFNIFDSTQNDFWLERFPAQFLNKMSDRKFNE